MKKKIFCILMSVIASLIIFGCSNDVNSTQPTESTTNKPGDDIVESNTTEKNDTEETSTTEHKHEYNEVIVEATCDKKGSKTFTCKTCNDTYSEEISALEHSYNVTTSVNATCTSKGSKTFTCSKCSHTYIEDVAMLAHNWKNATCTTAKACSVCGEKSDGIPSGPTTSRKDSPSSNEMISDEDAPICWVTMVIVPSCLS